MTESTPPVSSHALIEDPRPWAFTRAELTVGLRRYTGDPSLTITHLEEREITQRRPAVGRLRGLDVRTEGVTGEHQFDFVLKEPQGSTRAGAAGAGLREVSVYLVLGDHLPVRIPTLIASHPKGEWLILEHLGTGRRPENWQATEYLLATDQLVALHDRFWNLGEDLTIYPWLSRPLDQDINIYLQAAKKGAEKLAQKDAPNTLRKDKELIQGAKKIIDNLDVIANHLRSLPGTLLHGDLWPGNVHVHPNGSLTVFDWEEASIGPAVLDLLGFIQGSAWFFNPLPLSPQEIIIHYRQRMAQNSTHTWTNQDWEKDWDYAVLWTFISGWVDRLARIPQSLVTTRLPALEEVVFNPVKAAIKKHLS